MSAAEPEHNYVTINFEETELRLGLPGGKRASLPDHHHPHDGRKRGFSETVDLKLNLSSIAKMDGGDHELAMKKGDDADEHEMIKDKSSTAAAVAAANSNNDPAKPPAAKAQVVGWPPVRSFRKNVMAVQKTHHNNSNDEQTNNNSERNHKPAASATTATSVGAAVAAAFVKVSMDGAPYLRKVDLRLYNSYNELSEALGKMFSSFTIGMKDFNLMSESKLVDVLNGSEYVPTYQDKDGDWMLVGDVPWKMFVESCKRLRLMKGSEAIGLAPRAVEKCKNRS